jgi:hypothetical protein
MEFDYTVNLTFTAEKVETFGKDIELIAMECGFTQENSMDDLFCNNACANDNPYCNPFTDDDKLYFQWSLPMPISSGGAPTEGFIIGAMHSFILAELIDDNENVLMNLADFADTYGVGFDKNHFPFQFLVIDCSKLTTECFHLRLTYGDGYSNKYWYSEPFCRVQCEGTILLRGEYTCKDQVGSMYSLFDTYLQNQNEYVAEIRLRASFEKTGYDITKTIVQNEVMGTTSKAKFTLMTEKVPEYVADKIAICLAGKRVYIDGIQYECADGFDKELIDSSMWMITATLTEIVTEIPQDCLTC